MLTVASCTKEELAPVQENGISGKTITATFALPVDAKTSIADDGKTVTWAAGDSILVTDGSKKVALYVPDEADGQKTAKLTFDAEALDLTKTLFAVYPFDAFSSVSVADSSFVVKIPNTQSGNFSDANICTAVMDPDFNFAMKNATSVFKVTIADNIANLLVSGGAQDTLAANLKIKGGMVVEKTSPVKSIRVSVGGIGGDYYIAVAPGTYSAELSMMAITPDGQSQRVAATKTHTLAVNDLAYLGEIGENVEGAKFAGSGDEEDPFLLQTSGDIAVLAAAVNNGVDYAGTFFKVTDDIKDIEATIGTFDAADFYFKGSFDGDGHTLTLNIDGSETDASYLGLFGEVGSGASIKNLTVAGTVKSSAKSSSVAGVVGCINGGADGVTVSNVNNKAVVTGGNAVGGIVGYCDGKIDFTNCSNTGKITGEGYYIGGIAGEAYNGTAINFVECNNNAEVSGQYDVAGIVGYNTQSKITKCVNDGAITGTAACDGMRKMNAQSSGFLFGTFDVSWASGQNSSQAAMLRGVGGIAGYSNQGAITECVNNGTVTGVSKVGGIAGCCYNASSAKCVNNGAVSASAYMAGGILGYYYTCHGSNGDKNMGTVTAPAAVGGLIGLVNAFPYSSSSATSTLQNFENTANITATGVIKNFVDGVGYANVSGAGGVIGIETSNGGTYKSGSSTLASYGKVNLTNSKNSGTVTGPGAAVGGIVGLSDAVYYCKEATNITNCSNTGNVTGDTKVGGITGWGQCAYKSNTYWYLANYYNLSNSGTVTATSETDAVAGGLVGYTAFQTGHYANGGLIVANSYNTGDVLYAAAAAAVKAGGIIGYSNDGGCKNAYNVGVVGPVGGGEAVAATTGGVCGVIEGTGFVASYSYFNADVAAAFCGSNSTTVPSNVSKVDAEGTLDESVDISETTYYTVLEALNAWVGTSSTYYKWAAGPEFVK